MFFVITVQPIKMALAIYTSSLITHPSLSEQDLLITPTVFIPYTFSLSPLGLTAQVFFSHPLLHYFVFLILIN